MCLSDTQLRVAPLQTRQGHPLESRDVRRCCGPFFSSSFSFLFSFPLFFLFNLLVAPRITRRPTLLRSLFLFFFFQPSPPTTHTHPNTQRDRQIQRDESAPFLSVLSFCLHTRARAHTHTHAHTLSVCLSVCTLTVSHTYSHAGARSRLGCKPLFVCMCTISHISVCTHTLSHTYSHAGARSRLGCRSDIVCMMM